MLAGVCVLAAFLSAGLLIDQRLGGDVLPLVAGVLVLFAVIGGYGGWLIALIVFSAVRGDDQEAGDRS